ncbi:hypothetical protein [Aestuariirhabdus litorea]|uniref:hypothetical protein n=1 Tax=Aestuariirhabdus litorea TaxID=2528527 RepID=UPI0013E2F826|nr:hypothetical protein [Aestuariirhabdus litorea]
MKKKKPDFLLVVLLVFGLGVLSTGFASVAQSLSTGAPLSQSAVSAELRSAQ